MENIEVIPTANLIKFFGEIEMNKLIKADGIFSGFDENPVTFTGLGSDLSLKVFVESKSKSVYNDIIFLNSRS